MDDPKSSSQASNPSETHAPDPFAEHDTSEDWKEKMDRLVLEGKYTYDAHHGYYSPYIKASEVPDGETFATVSKRWEEHFANFQQSECWTMLREGLTQHCATHDIPGFDNAVCIALGSLSGIGQRTRSLEDRSASLYQLAEFVSVLSLLTELTTVVPESNATTMSETSGRNSISIATGTGHEITGRPIPMSVYAQEPLFNHLDKELLTSLGITVVVDPAAWKLMGKSSIVYSPGAEAHHFDRVAHMRPGMWWPIKVNYMDYVKIFFQDDPWDELSRTHARVDYTGFGWTPELLNGPKSSTILKDGTEYVFDKTELQSLYVRKSAEELELAAKEIVRDGDATFSSQITAGCKEGTGRI